MYRNKQRFIYTIVLVPVAVIRAVTNVNRLFLFIEAA